MNQRMFVIIGIVVAVIALGTIAYVSSCDASCEAEKLRDGTANFSHISPENFKEQLSGGTVIDVRTPEEYVTGHIPGAMLIDINGDDFSARIGQLDKTVPYYVYCRSGSRSNVAVNAMKTAGFENVYGLSGGISAWQRAGFGVE